MVLFSATAAVREFVRTRSWAAQPVASPIVFAPAAQLKNLSYEEFLGSTTKRANSLEELSRHLNSRLVISHWGTFLEAEALGSEVDLSSYPGQIKSRAIKRFPGSGEELASLGRFPVSLEVTRRLQARLGERAILAAGVTAPLTLVWQCTGTREIDWQGRGEGTLAQMAQVVLWSAVNFCNVGVRMVILVDETLPRPEEFSSYVWVLQPIVNAVYFHEAIPVYLTMERRTADIVRFVSQLSGAIPLLPFPQAFDIEGSEVENVALGLTLEYLEEGADSVVQREGARAFMFTTYGDLPFNFEISRLRGLCNRLQLMASDYHADGRS